MLYSISCQAICDTYRQFTTVKTKWPCSEHDACILENCDAQKSHSTGKFKLLYRQLLPGHEEVQQLLLNDPDYPLVPYMMRVFNVCPRNSL